MRNLIFWVIGEPCVGKTSYVLEKAKLGNKAVFGGLACREHFGLEFFTKHKESSSAPKESEMFVRGIVVDVLSQLKNDESLFIDGMPRNLGQLEWIQDGLQLDDCSAIKKRQGDNHIILRIRCFTEHNRRVRMRSVNEQDEELIKKRIMEEQHNLIHEHIQHTARQFKIPVIEVRSFHDPNLANKTWEQLNDAAKPYL